jgi:hypothetical protein
MDVRARDPRGAIAATTAPTKMNPGPAHATSSGQVRTAEFTRVLATPGDMAAVALRIRTVGIASHTRR